MVRMVGNGGVGRCWAEILDVLSSWFQKTSQKADMWSDKWF